MNNDHNYAIPGLMTAPTHPNLDRELRVGDDANLLIWTAPKDTVRPEIYIRLLKLDLNRVNVVLLDDPVGVSVFQENTAADSKFFWRWDKDLAARCGWPEGDARLFVDIAGLSRKIFFIKLHKTYVTPLVPPADPVCLEP